MRKAERNWPETGWIYENEREKPAMKQKITQKRNRRKPISFFCVKNLEKAGKCRNYGKNWKNRNNLKKEENVLGHPAEKGEKRGVKKVFQNKNLGKRKVIK